MSNASGLLVRLSSLTLLLALSAGCGGDGGTIPAEAEPSDAEVSTLARVTTGWVYYKNRADTLLRSTASGHSSARLRTRYNSQAATQLDGTGKVRPGATFPDSSLIVKELIGAGGTLDRYAVMMKLRGSENARGGWLWAYYSPTGATQISIEDKGDACADCHSRGTDHTRMNDSHP